MLVPCYQLRTMTNAKFFNIVRMRAREEVGERASTLSVGCMAAPWKQHSFLHQNLNSLTTEIYCISQALCNLLFMATEKDKRCIRLKYHSTE